MTYATTEPEQEGREFVHTIARRELVCLGCGYGIVVADKPPRCPMCGSEQWDFAAWRPFTGAGVHPPQRTDSTH